MPEICRFYGIIIFINYKDHAPPHFHAWYGDYKISITIKEGEITGKMPKRALKLIWEWMDLHQQELMELWEKAQKGEKMYKIEPLK